MESIIREAKELELDYYFDGGERERLAVEIMNSSKDPLGRIMLALEVGRRLGAKEAANEVMEK